jgi:hypothetical protein
MAAIGKPHVLRGNESVQHENSAATVRSEQLKPICHMTLHRAVGSDYLFFAFVVARRARMRKTAMFPAIA